MFQKVNPTKWDFVFVRPSDDLLLLTQTHTHPHTAGLSLTPLFLPSSAPSFILLFFTSATHSVTHTYTHTQRKHVLTGPRRSCANRHLRRQPTISDISVNFCLRQLKENKLLVVCNARVCFFYYYFGASKLDVRSGEWENIEIQLLNIHLKRGK